MILFFDCFVDIVFLPCILVVLVDAFDTEQLLECMKKLIAGQSVQVPIYDFKKHQRSSDSFRQVSFQRMLKNICL